MPRSYNRNTMDRLADINLGIRVDKASATLPAATVAQTLFTVSGGRVRVNLILGEVTTVIQTQANNAKIQANPTTGTTNDLCANLNITALEVGTLLTIDGTAATALQAGSSGGVRGQNTPVIVAIGTIELYCSVTNTGATKWSLFYVPIDDGASVA